jgi:hypothetical protein
MFRIQNCQKSKNRQSFGGKLTRSTEFIQIAKEIKQIPMKIADNDHGDGDGENMWLYPENVSTTAEKGKDMRLEDRACGEKSHFMTDR